MPKIYIFVFSVNSVRGVRNPLLPLSSGAEVRDFCPGYRAAGEHEKGPRHGYR